LNSANLQKSPQRYAFLDALRGIAAVAVVAVHTVQNFDAGQATSILAFGSYGVQLFYIISAFSLALSLEQRASLEFGYLRNYAIRRFFRIAPAFYLAVAVYLIKPWLLPSYGQPVDVHPPTWQLEVWHLVATVLFINGWHYQTINFIVPGGWSIAVETNFYLLFPLILALATTVARSVGLILLTVALGIVFRRIAYTVAFPAVPTEDWTAFDIFAGLCLPAQLPVFVLGVLLFRLAPADSLEGARRSSRLLKPLLLVMGAALAVTIVPVTAARFVSHSMLVSIVIMAGCWLLAWSPTRLVVNSLTCSLGRISYSLYLFHILALHLFSLASRQWYEPIFGEAPSFLVAFPCVLVCAAGISWCTYRLVEEPGQSLGRSVIRRLEKRAARVAAEN
jgi:peptidoglycan/LPS O-acetylase OafA/YrhL